MNEGRDEAVNPSYKRVRRCMKLGLLAASFPILISSPRISSHTAIAGDLLFLLTNPVDQESVVIGEVSSVGREQLIFEPEQVLTGRRVPKTIVITDYRPGQAESLDEGDAAVLTLGRVGRKRYQLAYPAFKVSSIEPTEADIVAEPPSGSDHIAYNWFINSCGAEKDFAFDYSGKGDVLFVKQAELVVIAQRSKGRPDGNWVMTAEPPACEPSQPTSWWRLLMKRLTATYEAINCNLGIPL